MYRWKVLVGILVLLVPAGCRSPKDQARQASPCPKGMAPAQSWESAELLGSWIRLLDSQRIMEFGFGDPRYVMASLGRVGAFTSPALKWGIDKDGLLQIGNDEGDQKLSYTLRKVCAGAGGFVVESSFIVESKGKVINESKREILEFAKRPFLQAAPAGSAPSNKPLQQTGSPP